MSLRYRVATVFGGSGFIGRHFIQRLARTGTIIRVATRSPDRANFLRTNGTVGQIVPIPVNIADETSVAAAVGGADFVVNLIGILHEAGRNTFASVHAELPGRIGRAARAAGTLRVVHLSAIGADTASPSSYGRSKAEGERALLEAFPEATILRPSVVFGPEDTFFNRFASMASVMPFLPLIGGGGTRFQPVYVGDVADAIMAALNDPGTRGRLYELGGPRVYTFREVMELVLRETRRHRTLVPVPWRLAGILGRFLGAFPNPPLTADQVEQLKRDNVVSPDAATLRDIGITPTAAEVILPTYFDRFRIGGRFADQRSTGGITH
jgi:uncharacterized protein YbjT (DUF2867 family)